MPYAENDGVKLYYERHGAGDLELLLVPEWCCARSAFAPQVERGVAAWNGAGALAACDVPMLMLLAYPAKSNGPGGKVRYLRRRSSLGLSHSVRPTQ